MPPIKGAALRSPPSVGRRGPSPNWPPPRPSPATRVSACRRALLRRRQPEVPPPPRAPGRRDSNAGQREARSGGRWPMGARVGGACPGRGPERVVRAEEEPPPPSPSPPLPPPLPRPSGAVSAAPPPPARPGAAPGHPARVQVRRGPSAALDGVGRGRPELAWPGRGRSRACTGRGPGRAGLGGDAHGPRRAGEGRPLWAPATGPGPDSLAAARAERGGRGVGTPLAPGLHGRAGGVLQAGYPGAGERSQRRGSRVSAFSAQRSRPTGTLPGEILYILLWSLSEDRGRSEVLLEVCKPFTMYEGRRKIYIYGRHL